MEWCDYVISLFCFNFSRKKKDSHNIGSLQVLKWYLVYFDKSI